MIRMDVMLLEWMITTSSQHTNYFKINFLNTRVLNIVSTVRCKGGGLPIGFETFILRSITLMRFDNKGSRKMLC
uniref:Uncharacterized protein n=1 Tax=Lepeophtheirus salmonis TaxID=72036 RepID=A0A0K2TKS7_LEPSM